MYGSTCAPVTSSSVTFTEPAFGAVQAIAVAAESPGLSAIRPWMALRSAGRLLF